MKATAIGKRVAKLRAAHGESLRDAAARTGVSHTTIGRIETGEVNGSFNTTLKRISDGYKVPMEWLLTGQNPPADPELHLRMELADDQVAGLISPAEVAAYAPVIRKAAEAGLKPQVLHMAIDLMIQQHRQLALA